MLVRLLRAQLRPYRRPITLVVLLQLVQTLATLYLPTLNAEIIDNGVITGNTGYIMRTGAVMIVVAVVQIISSVGAVYFGARTAMAMGRDVRAQRVHPGAGLLRQGRGQVRRAVADHQDDQRRPAGADARDDDFHDDGVGAHHVRGRHHPGAQSGRPAVLPAAGRRPGARRHRRADHLPDATAVSG